jgi:regulator of sigma E protease
MIKAHKLQNSAGGIVRMAGYTGIAMKDGPFYVWQLAAQISISLAIINLFPIPVLDGGHILAFFIEFLRRGKKMSPQVQQAFLLTGLAIIAVMFCLVTGNDIIQTIRHHVEQ